MTEPTPEMVDAARAVMRRRHWGIATADLADVVAAVLAVDPLRHADAVPVDRDLLRAVRMALDPTEERPNWARCLDLLDHLPDPDQP